ncbi:MAG: hypothetical protein HC827_12005 [Cyanobacteria bacterium RM1_2_2]|nr:hypothetical protein [Cyanobacteria bacterium RM1_2_2]
MKVFPSLSSWVHAAKLYGAASTGVLIFTVMFWFFILAASVAFEDSTAEGLPVVFLVFSIASLLAGFLLYQVVRFLYWAFLRLFWQHPPRSITPQGFRASLHSYSILTVASLPSSIIAIFYGVLLLPSEPSIIYRRDFYHQPSDVVIALFIWVWLLTAAYLYQWFPLRQQQKRSIESV